MRKETDLENRRPRAGRRDVVLGLVSKHGMGSDSSAPVAEL
jgi:hypothetical protein